MRRRSGRRALLSRWPRACSCAAALLLLLAACSDEDERAAPASSQPEDVAATQPAGEDVEPVELREYRTRPDLTPPVIRVKVSSSTTGGWLFLAPKQAEAQTGPLLVDDAGELVWSSPVPARDSAADFRVQTYLVTVPKEGFETASTVASHPVLVVEALDATGQVLGRSEPVSP